MTREEIREAALEDVRVWGLTPAQAAYHHARRARYYADRVGVLAREARRYSDSATQALRGLAVFLLVANVIMAVYVICS